MRGTNILILSPFFRPSLGGVETHLNDLIQYLCSRGHRVYVNTYTPNVTNTHKAAGQRTFDPPLIEKGTGFEVYRVKWPGNGLYYSLMDYPTLEFSYLSPALFLFSFIFLMTHKVDVINAHGIVAAFVARFLSKLFRKRWVVSIHAVYDFKEHKLMRLIGKWILSGAQGVLALSETSRKDLLDAGVPRNRISIYTHWVDQKIFAPPYDREKVRAKLGFKDEFVVLFVGRFFRTKGIYVLLKAAKQLPQDIHFVIIGSGPLETEIRSFAQNHKNIRFVGKVPLDDLVEYYGASDVYILPSVSGGMLGGFKHEEGFARAVIEALSCGTFVIVSNVGCLKDIIDPHVGKVVHPNPQDVSDAILSLYKNRQTLEATRNKCRKYALEKFSDKNALLIEKSLLGTSVKGAYWF